MPSKKPVKPLNKIKMWYIGEEIVAIKDHSMGRFKKGDKFAIGGIREATCGCGLQFDIGFGNGLPKRTQCKNCGTTGQSDFKLWFSERCFRPLISGYSEEEVESVNIDELLNPELETA